MIPQIQISSDGQNWETVNKPIENEIITHFWQERNPPDMVPWWIQGMYNGDVIYYRWVSVNPCCGPPGIPPAIPSDLELPSDTGVG